MLKTIFGIKSTQSQKFNSAGKRIPVTFISITPNVITQVKTQEKDGYDSIQIATGSKKNISKPNRGLLKKASLPSAKYLREIKTESTENLKIGNLIKPTEILSPGDIVNVTAVSKGKGFAGVVKRHHFRGGPKTHGQSDRHRAPGSIGQTTTPGRVLKGKRMAGHMGLVVTTQRNLTVLEVEDNQIIIKGTTPGPKKVLTKIVKVGKLKNFQPLLGSKGLDKEAIAEAQAQLESQIITTEEIPPSPEIAPVTQT